MSVGVQTFGVKMVSYVAGAVLSVFIARALGPQQRGVWSLALLVASILALLADGGLTTSALFVIRSWPGRVHAAVRMSVCFVCLGAAVWATVALGLAQQGWLGVSSMPWPVVRLVTAASLCVAATGLVRQLLTGLGDLRGANLSLLIQALVLPIAVVALVLAAGATAESAMWGYLAALALVTGTTLWRLRSRKLSGRLWDSRLIRPLVTYGARSQVGTLALILAYRSDLFLVDHALGASATGVYSVALTLSEILRGVPETGQALVVSRAATEADLSAYAESVARQTILITIAAGLALAVASQYLVPLVFGAPYQGASMAFACLVPGVVGLAVSYSISPLLFLHGQVMVSAGAALAGLATLWLVGLHGPGPMSLAKVATASSVAYWVLVAIQIAYLRQRGRLRTEKLVPGREDFAVLARGLVSRLPRGR